MSKNEDILKKDDSKKWITNVFVKCSTIFTTLVVLSLIAMNFGNLDGNIVLSSICFVLCLLAIFSLLNLMLRIKLRFISTVIIALIIIIEIEIGVAALMSILSSCPESYRLGVIGITVIMMAILIVFTIITNGNKNKHH